MVAIGYLAKMTIGDNKPYVDGLACTPGDGLNIAIGPGSMTMLTIIDTASYGSLPPDDDPLLKIGINTATTILSVLPGVETVISAAVIEIQTGSAALAYYNPADPNQTLLGVQNNGQAQATTLQQRVSLVASVSTAIPSGYIPLWQISVPIGAQTVDATMIAVVPTAPFIPIKLPQAAPLVSPAFAGCPTAPTPLIGDASGNLATTAFVSSALARNRVAWGTGGTYSWTCPAGVSTILVRAWGAGGSGGNASAGYPGGGGGGGGYEEVLVQVVSGTSYPIQVGSGKTGSTSTSFASLVVVGGGINGDIGRSGQSGSGGSGGVPIVNNINSIASTGVGTGQSGFQISNINVGGSGGSSFGVQGAAPCFGGSNGSPGLWPGGGGAGGATGTGGSGADGLLIFEWNG